ncbi:MAG: LptF/LptG family permease [Lentisphaeria bacterium]|nr:LptF/LptG family permease [Lentisphaeria bacterium]
MSDPSYSNPSSETKRRFYWMPKLDGYILRAFMLPFGILLFAFTLLFIIMDMYNDVGDFLDNKAGLLVSARYFLLKIPGNIGFILPMTVLLACMYALANLGRNRELTAIRASGISLVRCGLPIFIVGFLVMMVNYYFNEELVPETTRQAEIVRRTVENKDYVEQSNARLQFHSGDRRRQWYFGQFDDDGYQDNVMLKFYTIRKEDVNGKKKDTPWPLFALQAETTRFIQKEDGNTGFWEFNNPNIYEYVIGIKEPRILSLREIIDSFADYGRKVDGIVKAVPRPAVSQDDARTEDNPEQVTELELILIPSEKDEQSIAEQGGNVPFAPDELHKLRISINNNSIGKQDRRRYCFTTVLISEEIIPDKPEVIVKSVIEPDALSSLEIVSILRDNPNMAANLRRIYASILFNRLACPWACFLCAFFAFPLATKNERSGIFTAIATAVGIAVLYQVLNEVFMVAGKNGYIPPVLAGITPTVVFGAYGIYLLKKAG